MTRPVLARALKRLATAFARDRRGAAAVEMALLGMPFLILLFAVMQMGMYYMTQVALDVGVIKTAESLHAVFSTGITPVTPNAATLKSNIVSGSGTGVNSANLIVEIQPLTNLDSGTVAITDGLTSYGSAWTPLVLRAKFSFPSFASFIPILPSTYSVTSSAIIRRQGQ